MVDLSEWQANSCLVAAMPLHKVLFRYAHGYVVACKRGSAYAVALAAVLKRVKARTTLSETQRVNTPKNERLQVQAQTWQRQKHGGNGGRKANAEARE
eukprot:97665-Pleurochrysis_carterae.AAC.1